MKINQIGRSMVEIIGVLAIIGVLSVGAIAGYSKAMMKHKLNKQSTQFNQIFTAVYKYDNWGNITGSGNMIPMLKTLGEIPREMITTDTQYIYDVFKNRISISLNSYYKAPKLYVYLDLSESGESMEICRNIFYTVKEWHENMFVIESYGVSTEGNQNLQAYGDKYCSRGRTCLVDLTLDRIDNLCRAQLGREFMFQIYTADYRETTE